MTYIRINAAKYCLYEKCWKLLVYFFNRIREHTYILFILFYFVLGVQVQTFTKTENTRTVCHILHIYKSICQNPDSINKWQLIMYYKNCKFKVYTQNQSNIYTGHCRNHIRRSHFYSQSSFKQACREHFPQLRGCTYEYVW